MIYDFTFHSRFNKIRRYEVAARRILGVSEDDPEWIIRNNYFKLAKKYHPDINKDYEDLFRDINTAYAILTKKDFDIDNARFLTLTEADIDELEKEYNTDKKTGDYYFHWINRFF